MCSTYDRFRRSINRDGADYSIIDRVADEERGQLEADLVEHLDYFDILALGRMESQIAVPHLKRILQEESGSKQAVCGRALWEIEAASTHLEPIFERISDRDGTDVYSRINAIGLLVDVKAPEAFDALEFALFDPEYLVRYNAASIYTFNVSGRVEDQTIYRNVGELNPEKIARYAERLKNKRPRD